MGSVAKKQDEKIREVVMSILHEHGLINPEAEAAVDDALVAHLDKSMASGTIPIEEMWKKLGMM